MEKEIGKIKKNDNTDIVVRVDDFGGRVGVTIREYVTSERYTGFTKAGIRIPKEFFKEFREAVDKITEDDLGSESEESDQKQEPEEIEEETL